MPIARALESVKNWVSCQSTLDMNEIRNVGHVIRGHVIRGELYGTHAEGYAEEHQYWNESDAVNRLWDVSGVTVHLHSSDNVLISVRLDVKKNVFFDQYWGTCHRETVELMNRGSSGGIRSSTAVGLLELQRA